MPQQLDTRAAWHAFLELSFSAMDGVSRLQSSRHQGPLYIQKAFYPETPDWAHVYLLHPPGGVVSGDTLEVSMNLTEKANVLLTAPGATRLYAARKDALFSTPLPQRIVNTLNIDSGSCIEWLPCETIIYNGACVELVTHVSLANKAQFCGWEITCLGLPASNAPFTAGSFSQRFSIDINDKPVIVDRTAFDAQSPYLTSRCGLNQNPVFGTLIAGPFPEQDSVLERACEQLQQICSHPDECMASVTHLNGFIVLRYLGPCSFAARKLFIEAWRIIRPALHGREAIEPRIWAT